MIEIEDTHADVLRKAMVGQMIPVELAATRAGVDSVRVRALLEEQVDVEALEKLAPALNLAPKALVSLAQQSWYPEVPDLEGLVMVSTPFRGGTVNAFIIHDRDRNAVIFDTGTEPVALIEKVDELSLNVKAVVITHAHKDHVMGLPALEHAWSSPVYAVDTARVKGAHALEYGQKIKIGSIRLSVLETVGHAADGASFVVEGLGKTVVVVGDALFAGSMGGGMVSFRKAYQTSRDQLMSLDPETIVCPGHGPLTSIGLEQVHNAFFGE
ncbi:MAG: MBL fold metallo-hydrolase [Opitutales bacterium]